MDGVLVFIFVKNPELMKKQLMLVALAATMMAACSSPEPKVIEMPVQQEEPTVVVANAESKMFVSGMTCIMGCKGAIEKELSNTEGVESINIVFEDSIATVRFDSTLITEAEIVEAIGAVAGGGNYTATVLSE
jgi:copper chaperone CopZ